MYSTKILADFELFDSIVTSNFNILTCLIIIVTSGLIGLAIASTYLFIKRRNGYSPDFPISLIILPMVSSIIIYFVSDNIAGGLTLGGIFALTRFRSEQKDTEDLSYIFSTMGIGLACGFGYILPAIIVGVILIVVMIILHVTKFATPNKKCMKLKIIVPEDLNYDNLFDDILNNHCKSWTLSRVRTADFGTMFELVFNINVKNDFKQKEFIDELRTRNANLNITLSLVQLNKEDK